MNYRRKVIEQIKNNVYKLSCGHWIVFIKRRVIPKTVNCHRCECDQEQARIAKAHIAND